MRCFFFSSRRRHTRWTGDWSSDVCSSDLHLGYDASPWLDDADAILVLECDVPWVPSLKAPRPDCQVVHLGIDPLFQRYPIRGFPCDLAITGAPAMALPEL